MAGGLLLEVGAIFAALAVAGAVAARLGVSAIPLYIVAGLLTNRYVAGRLELPWIADSAFVSTGAELGVVLLLFFLGLEFDLDRLNRGRSKMGRAGLVDLAVNGVAGLAIGYLAFGALVPAVLVGAIVYISSSAVITKSLLDTGWIANPESEPILGVLVFEDLAIAVYLALVSAVLLGGGDGVLRPLAVATVFMAALLVLVAVGTPWLERGVRTPSTEFVVLRVLGVLVLVAGLALAAGVSEAVAAFFVGMAFTDHDLVVAVEDALAPVRDVFAGVFFFWIGLLTDPVAVAGVAGLVAVAVAVSAPTKLLSGYVGGRIYGLSERRSLRVGLAMTTRGEFSLIVAALAVATPAAVLAPAVAESIYAFAVGYVLALSVLGTLAIQYSAAFERLLPSA